jgi:hypothetical protein
MQQNINVMKPHAAAEISNSQTAMRILQDHHDEFLVENGFKPQPIILSLVMMANVMYGND